jgi:hypothetical protein
MPVNQEANFSLVEKMGFFDAWFPEPRAQSAVYSDETWDWSLSRIKGWLGLVDVPNNHAWWPEEPDRAWISCVEIVLHFFGSFLVGGGRIGQLRHQQIAVWAAAMTIERVIDFIVGKVDSIWSETDVQLEVWFCENDVGE